MTFWTINIISVFFISCIFAGILIPQILLVAFRRKLFDDIDERKIHRGVVPRLGGIAFIPVVFFSITLIIGIDLLTGHNELMSDMGCNVLQLAFSSCALIVIYLVGVADDLIGIRYRAKFIVQIFCGLLLAFSGLRIENLYGFLGISHLPFWIGVLLTIFLVVFITNAINLIDGVDGLASGLSGVALTFYGFIFYNINQYTYSLLAFATLGTIVPFFYYNVFGKAEKSKKIFMGDTGSLTIGIMLSILSIKLSMENVSAVLDNANGMVFAFAPLMVPCLDVIRVFFHRIRYRKNPFMPDKNHIHHKLLNTGMNSYTTMLVIILFAVLVGVIDIWVSAYIDVNLLLVLNVLLYFTINIILTKYIRKRIKSGLLPTDANDCNSKEKDK